VSAAERTIAALVDTLLPGDGDFPPASSVDTHELVLERLDDAERTRITAALGEGFSELDASRRVDAVGQLERDDPDRFAALLTTTYLSYYQRPAVAAVIRAQGTPYNDTPLPGGYGLPAFDAAKDAPGHARGGYVETSAITPIPRPAGLADD